MPVLKTPNGKIKFKTIPLFPGVKRLDREISKENLHLIKSILDKGGIPFQLHAGTLLGAVREHDFIAHDEDIDLAFADTYRNQVLSLLPAMYEAGFEVCRYDRRDLVSVMRKGEYIDFYFYKPFSEDLLSCSGWLVLKRHIESSVSIDFLGESFDVPKDWEEYLMAEYGSDWHTPRQWNNYEIPTVKRMMFNLKEYAKDYLPKPVFNLLSSKAERKLTDKSYQRFKRNLNLSFDK